MEAKTLSASSQDVARLLKQYPDRAALIGKGNVTLHGTQIVQRTSDGSKVIAVSQKYRLDDGTILPLSVD